MSSVPLWSALAVMALALVAFLSWPLLRPRLADGPSAPSMKRVRFAAIACAALAPALALAVYLKVGTPDFMAKRAMRPAAEFAAIAALPPEQQEAAIEGMVARLGDRLAKNPQDAEGWRMLARSNAVLGQAEGAARAFDGLFKATDGTAADWRGYMEILIALGPDDPRAAAIGETAEKLHALAPEDPLALYFLGDQARARGDRASAAKYWRALLAVTPKDAPIRPQIERLLAETEAPRSAPAR